MLGKKIVSYLFVCCTMFFSACKKEDIAVYEYKTLGTSAHDLLTASPYTALKIQIEYMPGFVPDEASISNLIVFLNAYTNKPGGISVSQRQIPASGKAVLALADIVNIEKSNRLFFTNSDVIAVHILITDGYYTALSTFATSYWNTSACIFGQAVSDNSDRPGLVTKTRLLSTVLEHEMGHLLGLVNQGSPMQMPHKDPDNGDHCGNSDCLMFYGIETNAGSMNSPIPKLDINCMNDLKANGGK